MEWNAETLQFLSQWFLQTLSSIPEPRRLAESHLSEASDRPNFGLVVLRLIAEPTVEDQTRLAAAVSFKNHLRARWVPARPLDHSVPILPSIADHEKEQIKSLILSLMLSSTPRIQSQLSEALSIIGKHDFPRAWPLLLPELVLRLKTAEQTSDYASINGMLSTANSIFKKFRYQYQTNDLLSDLKYCLHEFAKPLLDIFLHTSRLIDPLANSANAAHTLGPLIESQRLCCRIFYSLNFQVLPEFFEDHMNEWMTEFKKYLITVYPALEEGDGVGLELVDGLRAAVCENINLYMKMNEEEFMVYLNDFAQAVWGLLGNVSTTPSRERLTITAIKFLTTVSTSVHHTLFAGNGVIQQISQGIVIPNLQLREEDEDLFAMNYVEFIRRDIEGSDHDTKRRIACELLKGIAINYKDQVINIVSSEIQNRLSSFAANPSSNWKDKDCVIYLVVSLATKKAGGDSVSTDLVDVRSFFEQVIVPELQNQDVNEFPMLKAGALKFFTMFRNQIAKPIGLSFLPEVVRFLGAESNVVHSYAAICIDKILQVKDNGGIARNSALDIEPFLPLLMTYLFNALKFSDSEENPYIMKCIMRVLGVADISPVIAGPCIAGLNSVLGEVCKNPKNPIFNHYLFEAVAILVRRACEKDSSLTSAFEVNLFPSLEMILSNDISEFLPYAFQLFAQLVEINRPPIPQSYMQIFQQLLNPATWKKSANVPALVRLLQSFLEKAPHELIRENKIPEVLGIFDMLIHSPSTDQQGFYVLNTVTENLAYDVMAPFMRNIWLVLFNRLQNNPPIKFLKCFLIYMSLFLVKYGPANLVSSMNAVQENIFLMIVGQFWIPNLKWITGTIELKLTSVASTRLLCECPSLSDPGALRLWGKMLDSIVTLLSSPEEDRVQNELEVPDVEEFAGYTATFVRLYNAGKKEEDPLKEIGDPKQFLVASLANLSTHSPGRYPQIITENLDPANQTSLLGIFSTYKLAMA